MRTNSSFWKLHVVFVLKTRTISLQMTKLPLCGKFQTILLLFKDVIDYRLPFYNGFLWENYINAILKSMEITKLCTKQIDLILYNNILQYWLIAVIVNNFAENLNVFFQKHMQRYTVSKSINTTAIGRHWRKIET